MHQYYYQESLPSDSASESMEMKILVSEEKENEKESEVPQPRPVSSLDGVPHNEILNIEILKSRPLAPRTKNATRGGRKPNKGFKPKIDVSTDKEPPQKPPEKSLEKVVIFHALNELNIIMNIIIRQIFQTTLAPRVLR